MKRNADFCRIESIGSESRQEAETSRMLGVFDDTIQVTLVKTTILLLLRRQRGQRDDRSTTKNPT